MDTRSLALSCSLLLGLGSACGNSDQTDDHRGRLGDGPDASDDSKDSGDDNQDRHDGSSNSDIDAAGQDASAAEDASLEDGGGSTTENPPEGEVHIVKRMGDPSFDAVVTSPSANTVSWLNDHFYRMEVFTTFFDNKTSFYPKGWVYWDSAAIYVGSDTAKDHPDWILEDSGGAPVYLDWGCSNGSCPQYAADISNADFRKWWIDGLKATLLKGYKGAWIDDVNLALRFSNGSKTVTAKSPTSNVTMTEEVWSHEVAEFMQEVRTALKGYELLHNSIWYARPKRTLDADVKAQIMASDVINMEGGFASDQGLTGGTDVWSAEAKMAFADAVHALGRWVVVDDFPANDTEREYSLACYFMLSSGRDGLGDSAASPSKWWKGYDVKLGAALGKRTRSTSGLFRREFEHGLVLMLEPGASTTTVTLPKTYRTVAGAEVTSVSLSQRRGAVLLDR